MMPHLRPGRRRLAGAPACSDAEILTIALVRHLPGGQRDWVLPAQLALGRRGRRLWGAFEALRPHVVSRLPEDAW